MQPSTRIAKVLDKPTGTRITHGTVEDVQGDKVSVLVDNAAAPETLNRACVCSMGDRVIVVGNDAVATVGAYGGGGGGSIAPTSSMLKGDGSGNAIAATPGTDYIATMPNRALSPSDGGNASKANAILYGAVDNTSTSTAYTATIAGLTAYTDGTCMMLHNGVVTSASGFTVNVNNLGAKKCYNNMTNATQDTTIFNVNYTMLFVYDSSLDSGAGGWWIYRGYNSDNNTIGYQLRTNSTVMPTVTRTRYYRLLFTSADDAHWVPANTGYDNSATSVKTVNQNAIDPFGRIVYMSGTTNVNANANVGATVTWDQYTLSLGYSFNRTGSALTLTNPAPVFVKCAPQSNGSAIMDSTTPIVQSLPSSADGKIYIFLGMAYSATSIELRPQHPVYWHDGTALRIWTGAETVKASQLATVATTGDYDDLIDKPALATVATSGSYTDLLNKPTIPTPPSPSSTTPAMDGTASAGSSTDYARADHIHPTDTGRAASSHTHGSISNAGAITSDTSVASGDKLVITDSSDSSKLKRSNIALGSDTTKFLRNDGTWQVPSGGGGGGDVALEWFDVSSDFIDHDSNWSTDLELGGNGARVLSDGHTVILSGVKHDSMQMTYNIPPEYAPRDIEGDVWVGSVNYDTDGTATGYCFVETYSSISYFGLSIDDSGGSAFYSVIWPIADPVGIASVTVPSTSGLLAGNGSGGISAADPSALFVAEQVTVINGASVTNGGYSENTVTATKSGYYPLGVVGWTSGNRYPNVYGCRLTAQSVGSASVFCGASNFSGSTRTFTVTVTVLWVKVS